MASPVQPPPLPGDHVGAYLLGSLAGVGGMASVYQAHGDERGTVAVKILHPGKNDTDEARRFRREFLALLDLDHPGVVRVHETGVHGDYPWIAMEFVDGMDLGTLVERWQVDPPEDRTAAVEGLLRGICEALAYVHSKGFIHRDLKPSNVLVTKEGVPKLTDFGVVKAAEGAFATQLTVAGRLVGTVAFMAPEQISGEAVDQRADLYSLGAVLYELLTGQRPIQADSVAGYLARHLTERPRPPSELDPSVSPRLERICMKLLEKDPDQRFETADEVLLALDRATPVVRAPLHGRDREVEHLLGRARQVEDGGGGLVLVAGAPGVGKTALLDEFCVRARATGLDLARARGDRPHPLRTLLENLGPCPAGEEDRGSVPRRLALRTQGRRCVLVVDAIDGLAIMDLDALTSYLREQVAVLGEAVLVVASATDLGGPVGALASGATTGLSPERLDLGGLESRGVVALLRDRGLGGAAGVALGTRLAEALAGIPGLVVEQLTALEEAGWLERTVGGGLKSVRPVDQLREERLPLPKRVRQEEAVRLSRLDSDARFVLEALSVLGRESTPATLATICRMAPSEVAAALEILLGEGLVRRWVEGVQEVVAVASARSKDVVYALMSLERRSGLHRQAALALRGRGRRRAAAMAEVVARHLLLGGQPIEAYPLLIQAAERHFRQGRLSEAHRLLEQALDARPIAEAALATTEAPALRRRLYAVQGGVLEQQGDLAGARIAWERSLAAAREDGSQDGEARARAGLGLLLVARGEHERAGPDLELAAETLPQGDPTWPRVAHALARVRLSTGDAQAAADLWERVANVGREGGLPGMVAEAEAGLGLVAAVGGDLEAGRRALLDADLSLAGQGEMRALLRVRIQLAWIALGNGRLHRAVDLGREVERLGREVQRLDAGIEGLGVAACALAYRGDHAAARGCARDGVILARSRGADPSRRALIALLPLARALVELGAVDEAGSLLPGFLPNHTGGLEEPQTQLFALRARIGVGRDTVGAVEAARAALDRRLPPLPWLAARTRLDAAHALASAGDRAAVDAALACLLTLPRLGARMLQLEASHLLASLGVSGGHAEESARLIEELDRELGRPVGFRERWS